MVIVIVWIAFIHLEQKSSLNLIKKYVKLDFCNLVSESFLELNQYYKCDKAPIIVYAGLES